eukprot:gene12315-biopygen21467
MFRALFPIGPQWCHETLAARTCSGLHRIVMACVVPVSSAVTTRMGCALMTCSPQGTIAIKTGAIGGHDATYQLRVLANKSLAVALIPVRGGGHIRWWPLLPHVPLRSGCRRRCWTATRSLSSSPATAPSPDAAAGPPITG